MPVLTPNLPPIPPAHQFQAGPAQVPCVLEAANYYGLPANALLAIATNESGKNGHAMRNTNGTYDLGHMQINTNTFKHEIAPMGYTMQDIQWKGCLNVYAGAYLIKKHLNGRSDGRDFWTRLAYYHSRTPIYNTRYRDKLIDSARKWETWLNKNYQTNYVR